jgi:hypothetical protein
MRISRLQRSILELAFRDSGRYFTPASVKATYYGFPVRPKGSKIFFDKGEIGRERYNKASVAISHAFDHLARKGYIERIYGRGIRLTDRGREVAAAMMLND